MSSPQSILKESVVNMKNFWIEMAQEIGVELEEEFNYTIEGYWYSVKITENGLFVKVCNIFSVPSFEFASKLIAGEGKIKLLPFKPKDGDSYWTISCHSLDVEEDTWSGHYIDYHRKLQRLVFRTYNQAEKARIEYVEKLKEIGYKGE